MKKDKMETLYISSLKDNYNINMKLMGERLGGIELPRYYPSTVSGVNDNNKKLMARGGFSQQRRMIKDKRHSLDKAMLYSYQAALVKKYIPNSIEIMEGEREAPPVRALINPNKLKMDYDEKIISTGFENNFQAGDVFEWCNTHSYWLILLQDLNELAYFRGTIRRCTQEIIWQDEDGKEQSTFVSIRGPVETKIDYIQKHGISIDTPNHSIHIYMPKNKSTLKEFQRYSKFYLKSADSPTNQTCWRVEATDTISTPGILEINAIEYYANEFEDDIKNGVVGGLIVKPIDPNPQGEDIIIGETFIKPKREYIYYIKDALVGEWYIKDNKLPIQFETFEDEDGHNAIRLKWTSSYSGQFDIYFGDDDGPLLDYSKTIIVESLF